jgi:hypothetical protein
MPSPSRILDLCDAIVGRIGRTPGLSTTDGSSVQRSYAPTISTSVDDGPMLIQGRQVNVLPLKWFEETWIDRGIIQNNYSVAILTAELWTIDGVIQQGEVPVSWIDVRVSFVEAFFNDLKSLIGGDDPNAFLVGNETRCLREPEMTASVDVVALDTFLRERKLFWSVCSIDFIEWVSLTGE